MAVPDDREDRGPYAHSTDVNTDPSWMNGKGGAPVLGDGVKANIDDLTGFSRNMDRISTNYSHLGQALVDPLERMLQDAFPGGAANGLAWSSYLLRLAGHNAGQIEQFFGYSSMGMRNVAMAAQAAANACGNADETGAQAGGRTVVVPRAGQLRTPERRTTGPQRARRQGPATRRTGQANARPAEVQRHFAAARRHPTAAVHPPSRCGRPRRGAPRRQSRLVDRERPRRLRHLRAGVA
jgi:hypothetical protein